MSADASALPNSGVRSTFQVISARPTGSLSFWTSDGLSNNVWGQVGYFITLGSTPVGFYQVWNLTSNTIVARGTTPIGTGEHTFSMYDQNGTTWAYAIDGAVFGTYDMGSNSSSTTYPVYTLSEEQANTIFSFPAVKFTTVMQVLRSGSWNPVLSGTSYETAGNRLIEGNRTVSMGVWEVQGNLQNNELGPDQMIVGGSFSGIPLGTVLWDTGAGA
jgi:hypothetical protein